MVFGASLTPRDDNVAVCVVTFVDDPSLLVAMGVSLTVYDAVRVTAVVGESFFVESDFTLVTDEIITPSIGVSIKEDEVLGIFVVTGASRVVDSLPSLREDGVVVMNLVFGLTPVIASEVSLTEDDVVAVVDAAGSSFFVSDTLLTKEVIMGGTAVVCSSLDDTLDSTLTKNGGVGAGVTAFVEASPAAA